MVSKIYTRDFGRKGHEKIRYTPPPGYDGIAFVENNTKVHEAETDISSLPRRKNSNDNYSGIDYKERMEENDGALYDVGEPIIESEKEDNEEKSVLHNDSRTLEQLFESIRGKIGAEELIIILVMLVVASKGIGIEVMILGLLLIAR